MNFKLIISLLIIFLFIGNSFAFKVNRYTNDVSYLKKSLHCNCNFIKPIKFINRFGGNHSTTSWSYPAVNRYFSIREPSPNPLPKPVPDSICKINCLPKRGIID